jgi:hypothetical protein
VFRVLDFQGGVVDNGVEWEVEPEPNGKWQYKFIPDATGATLRVMSAGTLLLVK